MSTRTVLALAALLAIFAAPGTARAQAATPQAAVVAGPRLDASAVGVRASAVASTSDEAINALPAARAGKGRDVTLMIVGGAAFVAGALIGGAPGTLFMVGGAAIGLYGLYLYVQ